MSEPTNPMEPIQGFVDLKAISELRDRGDAIPKSVMNLAKSDYNKPELFLGQGGGLLDSIHQAYPDLFVLYEELKGSDWKHNEFEYWKCNVEFKTCSPSIYRMMIRTLAWQWEGDSAAARGLGDILIPMCTAMESRVGYGRIVDNENLHALTYSEIVRNSFDDPSVILNEILAIREAHGRMSVVGEIFEKARKASLEWQNTGKRTEEIENALMFMICGIYLLERVQFMASFAVTFGICEAGYFEPIGSGVQIIARDEYSNHVPFAERVFKHLMKTPWGQRAFAAIRYQLITAIIQLSQNEMAWVDYLHSDGDELPGVPPQKLKDWTLFNVRHVCISFGVLKEVEQRLGYELPTVLPLSYMKNWIDINDKQSSPQEQDNNQYLVNTVSKENLTNEEINTGIDFDFG